MKMTMQLTIKTLNAAIDGFSDMVDADTVKIARLEDQNRALVKALQDFHKSMCDNVPVTDAMVDAFINAKELLE